ncbi:hypothetical protein N0V90_010227 [Kalmusia sp. IMI 367209]|nr:hypothetical protein N0V90_010227 [Kalmusia sp. IMI 367209]
MATLKTRFGEFKGKHGAGVVQYLGINYNGVVDATNYGPRAPAMEASILEQEILIQQVIDRSPSPHMSGTECLNLNITVPAIETPTKLPVMVFVHGGGLLMGGNSLPYFDPSRFVRLSVEVDMPVIVVNVNYRLAVLGNLTSEELRNAGYPGNNSLRDQKCALQWIKAHISSFGGDPNNITAFGESAGSAAVLMQLFSIEPLFKRAIAMSGTPIMLKPLSPAEAEDTYKTMMTAFDLDKSSVEERIHYLTSIESERLVEKTPMTARLAPFVDGIMLPRIVTFKSLNSDPESSDEQMPGRKWCKELIIGDAQHDGNVFLYMGLANRAVNLASGLYTSFTSSLGDPPATAILEAYGITPNMPDDVAMQAAIALATDITYYAPALSFARSWPGKTYYYHFNEPNPWEGTSKGCSTHMLDAAFLFQNFNEKMGQKEREISNALAKGFIAFANGIKPWDEFDAEKGNVKAFGPSGKQIESMVRNNGWGEGRRNTLFRLEKEEKVDLDAVSVAWDSFVAGK